MQESLLQANVTREPERQVSPKFPLPPATQPLRISWINTFSVVTVHVLALTALFPALFSWTGVVLAFGGIYVFGTLGINLGFHRLLTHRGLTVPKWLEHCLAVLGVCCLQGTPARWAAVHRAHHQHSDEPDDPHSPLVGFLWGHFTWLFVRNHKLDVVNHYESYARDILRDPLYLRWERRLFWFWIYVAHAVLFFVAGLMAGWIHSGDYWSGVQFGASLLVWGVMVRTVLIWHITWSVNSLSHVWGYQTYNTGDQSRNNWFVALISMGEGWHNNHHQDQRSASHGHRWWELDVTYLTIRVLVWLGLAKNVALPDRKHGYES